MGMYDTLNDEQVKCFPWYSFDVISLSPEGSIGGHGGKLKYYGNGSEIPYRLVGVKLYGAVVGAV